MLFNSIRFLLFFPIVALLYYAIPVKLRWGWLLFASYFFYMAWNPRYGVLLAAVTLVTYLCALMLQKHRSNSEHNSRQPLRCRVWLVAAVLFNSGVLTFYKYFYFITDAINSLLSFVRITPLNPSIDIVLPVGISFYVFLSLGYVIDVYRGKTQAEKNLGKYALFVSFFPTLVAGPIERSDNLLRQIKENTRFDSQQVKNGLLLMLWGFFQKTVVADRAAIVANTIFDNFPQYTGFTILLGVVLFSVQIYCDFAGYSSIAIGAAAVMGFRLRQNFRQPYFATSVRDFWRRWHISLSSWFRDYLYIPLGGNRLSKPRHYLNTLIVFLLSGLWHGASWHYVVWGGLHGVYLIIGAMSATWRQKLYPKLKIRTDTCSFRLWQSVCVFLFVSFAWIFFRAPGVTEALALIRQMFAEFNPWVLFDKSFYELGLGRTEFIVMLLSLVVLFVGDRLQQTHDVPALLARQNLVVRWLFYYVAIIALLLFAIYGPGYNAAEFIYLKF